MAEAVGLDKKRSGDTHYPDSPRPAGHGPVPTEDEEGRAAGPAEAYVWESELMDVTIIPNELQGTVTPPPSKSPGPPG